MAALCEGGNEPAGSLKVMFPDASKLTNSRVSIVKEDEYEEVRWDGIVSIVSWREHSDCDGKKVTEDVPKETIHINAHSKAFPERPYDCPAFEMDVECDTGSIDDDNAVYYIAGDSVKHHHLRPALRRKRRHLVVRNPIILHDNARSHTAAAVKDLLCHWQWEILEHPPYSPDMSPCDYDLFAKVKENCEGPGAIPEMNLSVLKGGQYGTSTKMDAVMVYNAFQTFGKR
ncbi:hypothetical protein ANN_27356 [Periplaneta americana]|uniref:Uncharacterized protein n=1 Tax=Periplaneta americana TaxID=6978 RepID=A0ABQ8RY38_PERAM|nr:hypothetical protein ANN_27356 [Periplaneta americana]